MINTFKKILILSAITISFSQESIAQQPNLDSLWNIWQDDSYADTVRTDALHNFTWYRYAHSNLDSGIYYAKILYEFAENRDLIDQMSGALYIQGYIYMNMGLYGKAIELTEKNLAIQKELGNKKRISTLLNNVGLIYYYQDNPAKALEYYEQSLKIDIEVGQKSNEANDLSNIGMAYQDMGELDKALEYLNKGLLLQDSLGNKNGVAAAYNNIGVVFQDKAEYGKALEFFQKSLKIKEGLGHTLGAINSLSNIGSIYNELGKYTSAIEYCKKALELAAENDYLNGQQLGCDCLYGAYKGQGNGDKALFYLEKLSAIKDSLQQDETTKKLQQMEYAKQALQDSIATAEKERQLNEVHEEEMRQEKQTRNGSIFAGVFALLLAGGFYGRWRYTRKAKAAVEKEKDRSENLLLNILPEEIAKELKEKGRAEARNFDQVNVIFSDFKGFTELSATLSAAELVDEMNHCFEAFDGIMEKYGIEKIKTIGDAYMAAGGLPVPSEGSVKNTVLAALEMQAFIEARSQEQSAKNLPHFTMRVGIHTGPVVAGIVGVKKFQYDIWGDTVNTASRMESSGEVGKVNISESTYTLLKEDSDFTFENRGMITAKGKGEMQMYFVAKKEMK